MLSSWRKTLHSPSSSSLTIIQSQGITPFTYTGVDFAGPLFVKAADQYSKVWICLYTCTCCATRAVHLDLVTSLAAQTLEASSDSWLAGNCPWWWYQIHCNSKTFKAAARLLRKIEKNLERQRFFSGLGVEWNFNLSKAPWWKGCLKADPFYEEMSAQLRPLVKPNSHTMSW